jgi:hypothetical protein
MALSKALDGFRPSLMFMMMQTTLSYVKLTHLLRQVMYTRLRLT